MSWEKGKEAAWPKYLPSPTSYLTSDWSVCHEFADRHGWELCYSFHLLFFLFFLLLYLITAAWFTNWFVCVCVCFPAAMTSTCWSSTTASLWTKALLSASPAVPPRSSSPWKQRRKESSRGSSMTWSRRTGQPIVPILASKNVKFSHHIRRNFYLPCASTKCVPPIFYEFGFLWK